MKAPAALLAAIAFALAASPAAGADDVPNRVLVRLTPAAQQAMAMQAEPGAKGRTGIADLDTLLAAAGAVRVAPALRFPPAIDNEPGRRLRRYLAVEYAGKAEPGEVAARLGGSGAVEKAEPDGLMHALVAPDDSLFAEQWAHRNTGQAVAFDSSLVGVPDCDTDTDLAWDLGTGDPAIVLAIIDSGVDGAHEEFVGRIVAGYDFVHDDDDPMDDRGHGTACAGIAAAAGNSGNGVAGVGWNLRIMPVKVLNAYGEGSFSDISSGVVWAADHGARILSLSLGTYVPSSLVEDAVAYAYQAGCAVFCAAGNDDRSSLAYPAAYSEHTIPVGALSPCNERKSATSCDGEDWWGSNYGDLAFLAPGVRIHTTDITGDEGYTEGRYTSDFNGTSAATPHAAAIGGLVLARNPALTPAQLEYCLTRSSEDMGPPGYDEETGFGRLNAHLAVLGAFAVPVYVNASYVGTEYGTLHRPHNTLVEGIAAASAGGTIVVFAGTYNQPAMIAKRVTLVAKDGIATVGP